MSPAALWSLSIGERGPAFANAGAPIDQSLSLFLQPSALPPNLLAPFIP